MQRLFVAIAGLAATLAAQNPTAEQVAKIFSAYQHNDTPGCAVGFEAPGRDTWTGAYGMADLEHAAANTPATVFEAGSVSKQFTAAAVLLLVERGKISLDDDVRKYFPQIPAYQRPVTIRHLLNHTSGLRDWGSVEDVAGWPRTTRAYTHAHVLEIISRQHELNYGPGDAWSYTNSGYNLSAMLVEKISGMTLQAFCKKEFFDPLGMASTQWRDDFRRIVRDRAIAYAKRGSEWRQDMPFEDIYGNGGLLTTVGDLLKWNRNITSGKLHATVFEAMQKPGSLTDGHPIGYGFGLFLQDFQGLHEVSHSGATAGYRAWLGRIPEKGLSIAILCNAGSANPTAQAYEMARLYLNLPTPHPSTPADTIKPGLYRNMRDHATIHVDRASGGLTFNGRAMPISVRFEGNKMIEPNATYTEDVWERVEPWTPTNLDSFGGMYSSDEVETVLRVAVESGTLVIHRRPAASFTLKPTYKDAFESSLGSVRFLRDGSGKITGLSVSGGRTWDLRFAREDPGSQARMY